VESNICHGARLLKHLVRRTGSVSAALRRYNGCIRGRNTPRCHRYPVRVLRAASGVRRDLLISVADAPAAADNIVESGSEAAGSPAGSPPAQCESFVGCLRYRWTLTY
jgi:hypothetical protein